MRTFIAITLLAILALAPPARASGPTDEEIRLRIARKCFAHTQFVQTLRPGPFCDCYAEGVTRSPQVSPTAQALLSTWYQLGNTSLITEDERRVIRGVKLACIEKTGTTK